MSYFDNCWTFDLRVRTPTGQVLGLTFKMDHEAIRQYNIPKPRGGDLSSQEFYVDLLKQRENLVKIVSERLAHGILHNLQPVVR